MQAALVSPPHTLPRSCPTNTVKPLVPPLRHSVHPRAATIRASSTVTASPQTSSTTTTTADPSQKLNKYSSRITEPKSQGGSQAILYGVGLSDEDMGKPQIGISSVWYEGNTCNMHLLRLSEAVKEGVGLAGMVGFRFNTIGVSDAISMGTRGMCFSLQSRDLIADSIETVMAAQWYDGNISIPGCDKNKASYCHPVWGWTLQCYEGNTCSMHLLRLPEAVKEGVVLAVVVGFRFNTIGVSDSISMGTRGMCFGLQSRDLIADSIETVVAAWWFDGNISIPGCDKNISYAFQNFLQWVFVIVAKLSITIGVSDAISMGIRGMCFSLQSKDLIADSVETVMVAQWYDENIPIPGCDKNVSYAFQNFLHWLSVIVAKL
ncbi:dehydratase family [Actinidia rufa]|uniref:Dehydratase family n=1 Tax=Actinidia rufa TaxID=165716 RepID=A0A7J0E4M6_9ERIC|nr:dehydratase family [Actinidia rufa]